MSSALVCRFFCLSDTLVLCVDIAFIHTHVDDIKMVCLCSFLGSTRTRMQEQKMKEDAELEKEKP